MKRALLPLILAGLAAVLLSCAQQPNLTVSLSETSLTLVRGAGGTITVTVTGGTGPVELSVSGLPDDVTASFSTETLPAGNGESTLTIDSAQTASTGANELTVTASGAGRQATATLDLIIEDLEVTGTLVNLLGVPLPGQNVTVGDETVVSDADGNFSFDGLAVPYDVIVHSADIGHVFLGLTSASPTLMPLQGAMGGNGWASATVEGTLGQLVATGEEARVCVEATSGAAYGCGTVAEGNDAYTFTVQLPLSDDADIRLHALSVELDVDGNPVSFGFYGTAEGSVGPDETVTIDVSTLDNTIGSDPVTVAVSPSPGFTLGQFMGAVNVSDDFSIPVFDNLNPTSTTFTLEVPDIGEATYQLLGAASAGDAMSMGWIPAAAGDSNILSLPTPTAIFTPAADSTGIDTTTPFTVTGTNGRAATYIFDGNPTFAVTTTDTTVTIPDLSSVGLALPAASAYTFGVYASPVGGAETIEEGATSWFGGYVSALLGAQYGGPAPEAGSLTLNQIDFTTE